MLTGVAAYLFSTRHTPAETRAYLVKRGLVLMALEVFYLSELYWGVASPTLWLQVIWCISVCMIVLAALRGSGARRESPAMARLLVLACPATKRPNPDRIPALTRYDGPLWRTLRAADPVGRCAKVAFLSAHYGFRDAATPIADYDARLIPARFLQEDLDL